MAVEREVKRVTEEGDGYEKTGRKYIDSTPAARLHPLPHLAIVEVQTFANFSAGRLASWSSPFRLRLVALSLPI